MKVYINRSRLFNNLMLDLKVVKLNLQPIMKSLTKLKANLAVMNDIFQLSLVIDSSRLETPRIRTNFRLPYTSVSQRRTRRK